MNRKSPRRNLKDMIFLALFCCLLLSLPCCYTFRPYSMQIYDGPKQPEKKIAVVFVSEYLELLEIDGEQISTKIKHISKAGYRIEVLPGDHTFILYFWELISSDRYEGDIGYVVKGYPISVFFHPRAGHVYNLYPEGSLYSESIDYTIKGQDITTGEPVLVASTPIKKKKTSKF